jgi:hypothetical protein
VGGIYEVDKASGVSVTRTVTYYRVAGAVRISNTLYCVLKDHLGSASVVTDANGVEVGEQRYYPFGETRLTTGVWPVRMMISLHPPTRRGVIPNRPATPNRRVPVGQ